MRNMLLAGLAMPLMGCEAITGCKDDEAVVEVEFSSWVSEIQRSLLKTYQERGYTCRNDGAIRNAFGAAIGTRYVCKKC